MDSRLVHCSPPNLTSRPRVVAAVGVVSAGAELRHYDVDEAGRVRRHVVSDDFYATVSVYGGGLPATLSTEIVDLVNPRFEAYQVPRRPGNAVSTDGEAHRTAPVADPSLPTPAPGAPPPPGPNTVYAMLPVPIRSAARRGWSALPPPAQDAIRPGAQRLRKLVTVRSRAR